MPGFRYRGLVTRAVHVFMSSQLPPGAVTVTINGEACVPANNDESVARGVKGGPPPTDPYGFTIVPSTWESH